MPGISPSPNNSLGWAPLIQRIQALEQQAATGQTTTVIRDNTGDTVLIIGNISHDLQTNSPTLLTGFGLAIKVSGTWQSLALYNYP